MRYKLLTFSVVLFIFIFSFSAHAQEALPTNPDETIAPFEDPFHIDYQEPLEPVMAKAIIIDKLYEEKTGIGYTKEVFAAKITAGIFKDEMIIVENTFSGNPAMDMYINPGDKVVLALEIIDGDIIAAYPQDFYREFHIYLLIGIFVLVLLVIGQKKGLKALIALTITVFLITFVMLPAMLKGYDPLLLAMLISIIVTIITLVIICGFTSKTLAAIIGTVGGLLVAVLISIWVGNAIKLTGLSGQEAQMLMYVADDVGFNFKNLLFAGIIIGALGAVMDVSISISSSMEEIKYHYPTISVGKLFQSGMNVGKDIMGTMTNTLILAYTGTSMPLLLLFIAYQQDYLKIINMDFIATEFVRALSGSIGLVFAIPFTALASALIVKHKDKNNNP